MWNKSIQRKIVASIIIMIITGLVPSIQAGEDTTVYSGVQFIEEKEESSSSFYRNTLGQFYTDGNAVYANFELQHPMQDYNFIKVRFFVNDRNPSANENFYCGLHWGDDSPGVDRVEYVEGSGTGDQEIVVTISVPDYLDSIVGFVARCATPAIYNGAKSVIYGFRVIENYN